MSKIRIIYISIFTVIIILGLLGERIPLNNGLGFDGATRFAPAVRNYKSQIVNRTIDSYYIQRLVPSIAVDVICKILQLDTSNDKSILKGFIILDIISLVLSLFFFIRLMIFFEIKPALELISFLLLFFNFLIAKTIFTNPVLTDTLALCEGFAFTYGRFY